MQIERWSLRFRLFLWFTFLVCCAVAIAELALVFGYRLQSQSGPLGGLYFAGAASAFAILAVTFWVWKLFDNNMVKPIGFVSNALLATARTPQNNTRIAPNARYLGELGDAVDAVSQELNKTRTALAQTQVHEKLHLIENTEKLATLAADVPFGLMLLSGTHKIALYNGVAQALCHGEADINLGQNLFDLLDEATITAAYTRLCMTNTASNHVISIQVHPKNGSAALSARMRLMSGHSDRGDTRPPYILTLEADGKGASGQKACDDLNQAALKKLADIGATVHIAQSARDHVAPNLDLAELSHALDASLAQAADQAMALNARSQEWHPNATPALPVSGKDICDKATAHLSTHGIKLTASTPTQVTLNVDSERLVDLITYVAQQLVQDGAKGLSMLITPEDTGALIALGWSGEVLYLDRLDAWLTDPSKFGQAHIAGRAFIDELQTEMWPELGIGTRRVLKLPIAHLTPQDQTPASKIAYDFEVL